MNNDQKALIMFKIDNIIDLGDSIDIEKRNLKLEDLKGTIESVTKPSVRRRRAEATEEAVDAG